MKFFAWFRYWVRTAISASSRKDFYRRLENRKLGEGLGHLALLAAFLWVLPFLIFFFVDARQAAGVIMEGLQTRVPPGTVFEMKDGKFSDTLPAPIIAGNQEFKVIINSATSGLALAEGENGLVLSTTGITQQEGPHQQMITFAKAPDFRWTREEIQSGIARWTPAALFLGALIAGLVVFGLTFIGFFLSAAAHALLLWFVLKIAKRPWPWKRAFIATAYAATLPLVLNALLSSAGVNLGLVPNLLYWLIVIWIAYDVITRSPTAPGKGGNDAQKENVVDRPGEGGRNDA